MNEVEAAGIAPASQIPQVISQPLRCNRRLDDAMPVTLADIEDARRRIAGTALRTPLVRLNGFDVSPEIYLKLENLQPIGSFKIRGAANAMAHLSPAQLERGVLTASAGNMAQGVAWLAQSGASPARWWRRRRRRKPSSTPSRGSAGT